VKPQVAIVRNGDAYSLIKRALKLIDVQKRITPDSKVLIKPNLVRVPSTAPYTYAEGAYERTYSVEGDIVHRETIEGLLMFFSEMKIRKISIGESAGGCETPIVYKSLDLYELADKYSVELLDLNYAESEKILVPDGFLLKNVWVPKVVLESDFLINLPALKTHGMTAVTLSLKNWGLGLPPGRYYGINKTGWHKKGIEGPLPMHQYGDRTVMYGQEVSSSKVIVDVCSAIKSDLTIVDGITTIHYAHGAERMSSKTLIERTNMMIAGYDMVATDAVCTRIMGFNPEKILHIKWAAEKGIGICDLSRIEVVGERIEDVELRCNPLTQQAQFISINQ